MTKRIAAPADPANITPELVVKLIGTILGPDSIWKPTIEWAQERLDRPARCRCCSRPLRNRRSVARGLGPVCAGKAGRTA